MKKNKISINIDSNSLKAVIKDKNDNYLQGIQVKQDNPDIFNKQLVTLIDELLLKIKSVSRASAYTDIKIEIPKKFFAKKQKSKENLTLQQERLMNILLSQVKLVKSEATIDYYDDKDFIVAALIPKTILEQIIKLFKKHNFKLVSFSPSNLNSVKK